MEDAVSRVAVTVGSGDRVWEMSGARIAVVGDLGAAIESWKEEGVE